MTICTKEDSFTIEKVRWVAVLSNGETVLQDDYREGCVQPIAWLRLRDYVKENGLSIVSLNIQFCDHIEEAAIPNATGYYYIKAVDAVASAGVVDATRQYYVVGHLGEDGLVHTKKWLVPEIIKITEDVRKVEDNDICLILNNDVGVQRPHG